MENKKTIKLLEEIRDLLKTNQSKYNDYLQSHKKMQTEYMKKTVVVIIIFLLLALLIFSILPFRYY